MWDGRNGQKEGRKAKGDRLGNRAKIEEVVNILTGIAMVTP